MGSRFENASAAGMSRRFALAGRSPSAALSRPYIDSKMMSHTPRAAATASHTHFARPEGNTAGDGSSRDGSSREGAGRDTSARDTAPGDTAAGDTAAGDADAGFDGLDMAEA